ncbi:MULTISPECIES: type II toxin-antitoxin system HicB family antitoxin [Saccharibacillus]|uniref:type II toxin-antitoxin system HicB family antitoxin n=1 Tax=Saccharibacillus TaxID=456492 RepID=UPI0012389D77|nr:type II toxin-antitoxin system HicB family antitoxin [Saccharibacillus sp. WB 17]MWJ32879.1 type II toxin-antitoxin system HicB family antitoxin [Saccharibacillus sp. WB 17]
MKDRYVFPAVLDFADDGISVEFPDLPGAFTDAQTDEEALEMAKDCLALHLYGMEEDGEDIPQPSRPFRIELDGARTQAVTLVEVWMPPFRNKMSNRSVKKTLTIPKWLDDLAASNKVNYSHVLQEALKSELGVNERERISGK